MVEINWDDDLPFSNMQIFQFTTVRQTTRGHSMGAEMMDSPTKTKDLFEKSSF